MTIGLEKATCTRDKTEGESDEVTELESNEEAQYEDDQPS